MQLVSVFISYIVFAYIWYWGEIIAAGVITVVTLTLKYLLINLSKLNNEQWKYNIYRRPGE